MALRLHLLLLFLLSSSIITSSSSAPKRNLKEKLSHLHFFFHDIISGPNPTAVPVIKKVSNSFFGFGSVTIIDDPLTEGPDPGSRVVGRAQGMYSGAAQDELGLLMIMNLAFTSGKYNGSVLSVVGRNQVMHRVREMPVVGGSGLFRFARGYALARTHSLNSTGDAIVEYDVYVLHY